MLENAQPKKAIILKRSEWKRLINKVFVRDKHVCQLCHRNFPATYLSPHHIIPKGRIRLDVEWNILTTCKPCHDQLHRGNLDTSVDDMIRAHGLERWAACKQR